MSKVCSECGEELKIFKAPKQININLPFIGDLLIIFYQITVDEYFCEYCELEKKRNEGETIYRAGFNDGFERGLDVVPF